MKTCHAEYFGTDKKSKIMQKIRQVNFQRAYCIGQFPIKLNKPSTRAGNSQKVELGRVFLL